MAEPKWRRYLRFWRSNLDADLDDELRFHLEERMEALVATGLTREDARCAAEREFGDVRAVRDRLREIDRRLNATRRRARRLEQWRQDFAYSVRSLRRTPGIAGTIIVTLALGIGVNATLFSLLDRVFIETPAGIGHADQVRRLYWQSGTEGGSFPVAPFSMPMFDAMSNGLRGVAPMTVYQRDHERFGNDQVTSTVVTLAGPRYFTLLDVQPAFGRFFSQEEERVDLQSAVAVMSDAFWRRRFGGSPADAIGQMIVLNKHPFTVIGVAPREFRGTDLDATDVWVPLGMLNELAPIGQPQNGIPWYRLPWLYGFGVLARPIRGNVAQFDAAATVAVRRGFAENRREGRNARVLTGPLIAARGPGEPEQEASIAIRLGGVSLIVLLIACANVANLLLARAIHRRREIGIRVALGIGRAGIVKLFLTESVIGAMTAGVVALLISAWAGALLRRLLFPSIHWVAGVLDWRIGAFTALIALATGIVAGFGAAIRASRTDIVEALKSGGRQGGIRSSRLRSALVATQAAFSTVLLIGAVLFVESLHAVRGLDLGYDVRKLVSVSVKYEGGESKDHDVAIETGISELAGRLARLPGVEHVALANMSPMYGFSFNTVFYATGDSFPKWSDGVPEVTAVSPEYFATIGLRLDHGRGLTGSDVRNGGVAIVNRTLARSSWPHEEATGQCLRIGKPSAPCLTVVGVAEDARRADVVERPVRQIYIPVRPSGDYSPGYVIVRVAPDQAARLALAARQQVPRMFSGAEADVIRMADVLAPQYRPWELGASLFSVFGILALIVAAIGVFSALSHDVSQRRHELGVRAALGAGLGDIVRLVVGQGLRVATLGAVIGVTLALAAGRLIASLLYGVSPSNPLVLILVTVLLTMVAVVASALPAWRASRTDPLEALRAE